MTEVSGGLLVSELVCSDIVGFDSAVLFELLLPFSVLSVLVTGGTADSSFFSASSLLCGKVSIVTIKIK